MKQYPVPVLHPMCCKIHIKNINEHHIWQQTSLKEEIRRKWTKSNNKKKRNKEMSSNKSTLFVLFNFSSGLVLWSKMLESTFNNIKNGKITIQRRNSLQKIVRRRGQILNCFFLALIIFLISLIYIVWVNVRSQFIWLICARWGYDHWNIARLTRQSSL